MGRKTQPAVRVAAAAAAGMAGVAWDADLFRAFDDDRIAELKKEIEAQGLEYRRLVIQRIGQSSFPDTLFLGGVPLSDLLEERNIDPELQAAYAAAHPNLASHSSFTEAVRSCNNAELTAFLAGVKGKLFQTEYAEWLNDGNLPAGYVAGADPSTQPGWEIAIHGPDRHVAELLQLKATDSLGYVRRALERYPDIDVVMPLETYSQLVMNGIADEATGERISADPVIPLALSAFSAYTPEGAAIYAKARLLGSLSDSSRLAHLIGGGVTTLTQNWWLGLLAGVGSRFLTGRGSKCRGLSRELRLVKVVNELIIHRLTGSESQANRGKQR